MGSAAALELSSVGKSYGVWKRKRALGSVTLRVERGECFGLAGANGAGKTTLIRILLGLIYQDEGEARLLGERPDHPEVRRRVGFVPESATLPETASPRALVRRWARLRGLPAQPSMAQGLDALERLGMAELLDRPSGKLSKGERQRTLLALAMLGSPELLVLDEPTDGLDPLGRARMREVIRAECDAGRTVFLNSHLLGETERICTRVGILHQGELVRMEHLSGRHRAADPATTAIVLAAALTPEAVERARVRSVPEGSTPLRDLLPAGATVLVAHQDLQELNSAIDRLRAEGALLVEVRRVKADLEAALAEVATGTPSAAQDSSRAVTIPERKDSSKAITIPEPDEPSRAITIPEREDSSRAITIPEPGEPATAITLPEREVAASKREVAASKSEAPGSPLEPLAPAPAARRNPLRGAIATLRVAQEIADDLRSRRVGWIALGAALLATLGFLFIVRSEVAQGAAALAHSFGNGEFTDAAQVAAMVSGTTAKIFFWASMIGGVLLAAVFSGSLLEPRRTQLLYSQPITRADYAIGIWAATSALAMFSHFFFTLLAWASLRWLGIQAPPSLLLTPLVWVLGFSSILALQLFAGFAFGSSLFTGVVGVALVWGTAILGSVRRHPSGDWRDHLTGVLYALLPRGVDLMEQAGRIAEGKMPRAVAIAPTAVLLCAYLLFVRVLAQRSER